MRAAAAGIVVCTLTCDRSKDRRFAQAEAAVNIMVDERAAGSNSPVKYNTLFCICVEEPPLARLAWPRLQDSCAKVQIYGLTLSSLTALPAAVSQAVGFAAVHRQEVCPVENCGAPVTQGVGVTQPMCQWLYPRDLLTAAAAAAIDRRPKLRENSRIKKLLLLQVLDGVLVPAL